MQVTAGLFLVILIPSPGFPLVVEEPASTHNTLLLLRDRGQRLDDPCNVQPRD